MKPVQTFMSITTSKYLCEFSDGSIKRYTPQAAGRIAGKTACQNAKLVSEMYNPASTLKIFEAGGMEYYNLYTPSKYLENVKDKSVPIPKSVQTLLDHLFSNTPDEMKELFLDLLSYHLRTGKAIHIGWMFIGIEGAGKGVLKTLLTAVFGESNTTTKPLSDFTGDKVKGAPNTLLLFIDESIEKKKGFEVMEGLKRMIANLTYPSRALYADTCEVINHAMVISMSNSFNVIMSADDRRFNFVDTRKKLKDSVKDVAALVKALESDEVIQDFTTHLKHRKAKATQLTKIISTEFKDKMVANNLNWVTRIARTITSQDVTFMGDLIDVDDHDVVTEQLSELNGVGFVSAGAVTMLISFLKEMSSLSETQKKDLPSTKIRISMEKSWVRKQKKIKGVTYKGFYTDKKSVKNLLQLKSMTGKDDF